MIKHFSKIILVGYASKFDGGDVLQVGFDSFDDVGYVALLVLQGEQEEYGPMRVQACLSHIQRLDSIRHDHEGWWEYDDIILLPQLLQLIEVLLANGHVIII